MPFDIILRNPGGGFNVSFSDGPPPTGGKIKVWSGSAWVEKPVKYWNGSAWVEKPLKV